MSGNEGRMDKMKATVLSRYQNSGFPATLLTVWLFTIPFSFHMVYGIENESLAQMTSVLLHFLFYYGCGSFALEAFFFRKPGGRARRAALLLNLIPAALWAFFWTARFQNAADPEAGDFWAVICAGYFFCLLFLGIFFCFRRLGCPFYEYLLRVFGRVLRCHMIYGILAFGSLLLTLLAFALFDWNFNGVIFVQMLLLGLYYVSALLLSFSWEKEETSVLVKGLVRYVLPVLTLLAFLLVYGYMLLLLIRWEMPDNAVYRIAAGLFLAAMPLSLMNRYYEENGAFGKAAEAFPFLFLPLWFLQSYALAVRIGENGITPLRYLGVILLFVEAAVIVLSLFRRGWLGYLPLLLSAAAFVLGLAPFSNACYVSYYDQRAALRRYLALPEKEKGELLAEYREQGNQAENAQAFYRYRSAYSYLRFDYLGKAYLARLPREETKELEELASASFAGFTSGDLSAADDSFVYSYAYSNRDSFSVEGYKTCRICSYNEDTPPPFDADALLRQYLSYAENSREYLETHAVYPIGEGRTLVMTYLSYRYDKENDCFTQYQIEGYLLEK